MNQLSKSRWSKNRNILTGTDLLLSIIQQVAYRTVSPFWSDASSMDGIIWFDPKILCLVPKEEDEGGYGKGSKYSRRKIFSQQREEERRKRTKIYLNQEREKILE